jgi:hypothetical protein
MANRVAPSSEGSWFDDPDDDRHAEFTSLEPLREAGSDGAGEFLVAEVGDRFGNQLG